METIDFAYNSELDMAHFFVSQPYIGAGLYDIFQEENLLKKGTIPGTFIFSSWHDTITMTSNELNKIQLNASRGWVVHKFFFYLKPKNFVNSLLSKFKTMADFRYSFGIFQMLINKSIKETFKRKWQY